MSELDLSDDEMFMVFMLIKERNRNNPTTWFCGHSHLKHYAKGLCSSCYHSPGETVNEWLKFHGKVAKRTPRAVECAHTDRIHRARGLCAICYSTWKRKRRLERELVQDKDYILGE